MGIRIEMPRIRAGRVIAVVADLVAFGDGTDEMEIRPAVSSRDVSVTLCVAGARPENPIAILRRPSRPPVAIVFRRALYYLVGEPLRCGESNGSASVEWIALAAKTLMMKVAISQRPMLAPAPLDLA